MSLAEVKRREDGGEKIDGSGYITHELTLSCFSSKRAELPTQGLQSPMLPAKGVFAPICGLILDWTPWKTWAGKHSWHGILKSRLWELGSQLRREATPRNFWLYRVPPGIWSVVHQTAEKSASQENQVVRCKKKNQLEITTNIKWQDNKSISLIVVIILIIIATISNRIFKIYEDLTIIKITDSI